MLTSAASSPPFGMEGSNPDDNIAVTDLTGDESTALSQADAPAVPNPAIRQPVGKHQAADPILSHLLWLQPVRAQEFWGSLKCAWLGLPYQLADLHMLAPMAK
jgi:hypothetical protein